MANPNISFEGIGAEVVTVKYTGSLRKGNLCRFTGDKLVTPAQSGGTFSGKVLEVYPDGTACVQIRGYIEVQYTGDQNANLLDWQKLKCTSTSNVTGDANGREYLVIHQNTTKRVIGIML